MIYQTGFHDGTSAMIAGDFTGNGELDLIVVSNNSNFAEIFLGNGKGGFVRGPDIRIGENRHNITAADLNNAFYPNTDIPVLDLITTSTNTGNVYVQMGNPNDPGTFSAPPAFTAMKPLPGENHPGPGTGRRQ